MNIEHYQNVIIGAGESGKYLAWSLAKQGQKTVVIERSMVGGACPNVACLPSKNLIYSAKIASLVGRAAEFGISTGPTHTDIRGVIRRKRDMVDALVRMNRERFTQNGAELVMGEAKFVEPKTIYVTLSSGCTRAIRGDKVFVAVGSRAAIPNVSGLPEAKPMTHVEALELDHLPAHLIVLGGGYVGLEFAQAMRRFGSQVTIVHDGRRLLDREDPDVSEAVIHLLQDEGITVMLQTSLHEVIGCSGKAVTLKLNSASGPLTIPASDILVATGRTSNADGIDAMHGGIRLTPDGSVEVDDRLRTTAPDTWAMGDCAGSPHFTHVSFDDHRVVRDNLAGGQRTTCGRLIPYCLFTDPQLGRVGLNETTAVASGIIYRLAKMPMSNVLRTWTVSEERGFMKALVGKDDRVLGFTAFGAEAGELIAVVQTAMLGNLPYTVLRDGIFTHPTVAEGLGALFSSI